MGMKNCEELLQGSALGMKNCKEHVPVEQYEQVNYEKLDQLGTRSCEESVLWP